MALAFPSSAQVWGVGRVWLAMAELTIFLGAFLLFQIELLIAKLILPWFGGSAAVWLACLMFFQLTLLAGYLYAHVLASRVSPLWRTRLHILLLLASLAFLPVIPADSWKPAGDQNPLPLILALLASTIGLPFLLLSSATPLLQSWIAGAAASSSGGAPRHSIYRLYALSNLGSMLALLSYPLIVEPLLPIREQAWIWSAAYLLFAVLYIAAAWHHRMTGEPPKAAVGSDERPASILEVSIWVLLPLAASALLLAITNHILRDIAAIPLFWMVPLALYLLSFIVCFEHPRWYYRPFWLVLFAVLALVMSQLASMNILTISIKIQLAAWLLGLLVTCMVCHGELARLKPALRYLTSYYLAIAAGGAAGGILVTVVAPSIFRADFDVAIILPATALLVLAVLWHYRPRMFAPFRERAVLAGALLILAIYTGEMTRRIYLDLADTVFLERNFYGSLRVEDFGSVRSLLNGNIVHGRELLPPSAVDQPISYYNPESGIGLALTELGKDGPLKVGTIGLGAGMISAYARAGDIYRFYEVNPVVPEITSTYFQYLPMCKAICDIALGDARLSLEREEPQAYDVLAIDAFSSDAIPIHMLTREAFALYWRHLRPDGVLAVHVSNLYLDLVPIVALAAKADGKTARLIDSQGYGEEFDSASWVLVTGNPAFFDRPAFIAATPISSPQSLRAWTDDYSNIWRSLR